MPFTSWVNENEWSQPLILTFNPHNMKEILAQDLKVGDIVKDVPIGNEHEPVILEVIKIEETYVSMKIIGGDPEAYTKKDILSFSKGGTPWYQY